MVNFIDDPKTSPSLFLMDIHLIANFLESSSGAVVRAHSGLIALRKLISPACLSSTEILRPLRRTLQQVYRLVLCSEKKVFGQPCWTQLSPMGNICLVLSGYHSSVGRCQLPSGATQTHMHTVSAASLQIRAAEVLLLHITLQPRETPEARAACVVNGALWSRDKRRLGPSPLTECFNTS